MCNQPICAVSLARCCDLSFPCSQIPSIICSATMSSSSSSEEFSESSSDVEAETGAHASASTAARPSLATQLRGMPLQRQVDSTQFRTGDPSDLSDRLAALQYQNQHQDRRSQGQSSSSSGSESSPTSSMAVSVVSQNTLQSSLSSSSRYPSSRLPSLSGTCSTFESIPSVKTVSATAALGHQYALERDDNDIGHLAEEDDDHEVRLQCSFSFLGCLYVFRRLETWDTHCRAHYGGKLPSIASCPFPECRWSGTKVGQAAWEERLEHMLEEHDEDNFVYGRRRPEPALLEHLRLCRVIDNAQYQELRRDGHLSDRAVPNYASRRDEARRRRR